VRREVEEQLEWFVPSLANIALRWIAAIAVVTVVQITWHRWYWTALALVVCFLLFIRNDGSRERKAWIAAGRPDGARWLAMKEIAKEQGWKITDGPPPPSGQARSSRRPAPAPGTDQRTFLPDEPDPPRGARPAARAAPGQSAPEQDRTDQLNAPRKTLSGRRKGGR